MPFRCLICASEFQPRNQPAEFDGVVKNIFATFSNYLVASNFHYDNYRVQFCSSCRSQYLKSVHERHMRSVELRAENAAKVSQFSKILQKISAESQQVDNPSANTIRVLPSVVETTAGNEIIKSKRSAPIDLKYLNFPYQKFPTHRVYKCTECDMVTGESLAAMKAHIRHVHLGQRVENDGKASLKSYSEDTKTNRITYCGKYFCEKLPNGSFKCGSCDFVSKGPLKHMLGHIRMKHAINADARALSGRLIEVSPNKFEYNGLQAERTPDGHFLCGYCPFTTKAPKYLRRHLNGEHATDRSKVCEVCGKIFKNERRLYSHLQIHPTGTDRKCTHCDKCFDTKSKFWSHFVRVHKQYRAPCTFRTYVCEICGKEYKTKAAYRMHMNNVHQGLGERKKFDCKVCGKVYASYMPLHVHMNSHTGKKVHACDVCGMKFTQGYSVVRHKKVVHNVVKDHRSK